MTDASALEEALAHLERVARLIPQVAAAQVGLTVPQLGALVAIAEGARRVKEVAARTYTSVSAASRTVDALVRAELVTRHEDPADRRAVVLALTPRGTERIARLEGWRAALVAEIASHLGPSDTAELATLLRRFADALATATAARSVAGRR